MLSLNVLQKHKNYKEIFIHWIYIHVRYGLLQLIYIPIYVSWVCNQKIKEFYKQGFTLLMSEKDFDINFWILKGKLIILYYI